MKIRSVVASTLLAALSGGASAFTVDDGFFVFAGSDLDVDATLAEAPRWDAAGGGLFDPSLADGIRVGVTGSE